MSDDLPNITTILLREIRDELKKLGRDVSDVRTVCLGTFERVKRVERRLEEVRDDMEATIKAEIMGTGEMWRRDLEKRIEAIEQGQH